MKKLLLAKGKYSDGVIYLENKEKYVELENKIIELQIFAKNSKRSNKYNAYYWSFIIPLIRNGLKELGTKLSLKETDQWLFDFMNTITKEQTHEFLKNKFCTLEVVNENTGEIIESTLSTKMLDKDEFDEYINDVIRFANETLNIKIESDGQNEYS